MRILSFTLLLASMLLLVGCASTKKVPYLIDADTLPAEALQQATKSSDPIVMPGDLIDIIVTGSNVDAVKPFNRTTYVKEMGNTSNSSSQSNNSMSYYLVDNNGYIEFPVIGKLHIGGLTKTEVQKVVEESLCPKYLTEKPVVDIRFRNFRISVLGEVGHPGVITAPNERLNILEAIAMAGDLTIKGMRENIMLIRTNPDGSKLVQRIDLNDKNLLLSPNFNLQQNDVLYVQPNSSKANSSWSVNPVVGLTLGYVGTLMSIATFIITLTKL